MKKIIIAVLCMLLTAGALAGCGEKNKSEKNADLSIVATIFPGYDWVREIMGDEAENADITMLMDNGTDLHSYQPTADDISKISKCDLFIYAGGESDEWVKDALKQAENKDMKVINMIEMLGDSVKTEEVVEGMESEHDHDHDEDGDHHDSDQEVEYDEHTWLSLKNAEMICEAIENDLSSLDPENKDIYKKNSEEYISKLSELDSKYQKTVDDAARKTVLFGDRFPFRYLTDDYGLDYYAAFVGCSAETEASFKTVKFLAEKVDELDLPCVMTIEGSDHKIAETIIRNTADKDQKVLTMDSMQAVTASDLKDGKTYLSVMEKNLEALKEALN
ncbi:MAG: metal ABC transporter substrate-binding protein [Eubacteriales bacterium]|nr:metal ABC transporter substrate-binding protein [Eubacteriales bacterium]